jgi:hypothetical protein
MRSVHLTDQDLELAEQALRMVANRYRSDANNKHSDPVVRNRLEQRARECEQLADRMDRFRESSDAE